jgi:hypothetical protein
VGTVFPTPGIAKHALYEHWNIARRYVDERLAQARLSRTPSVSLSFS